MADQQIGQLLDTLGVTADLDDEDLPVDALVLIKIVKPDGAISFIKATSESLDWITSLGMLTAALHIENNGYVNVADEDD
ncbi:hypothetical protein ASD97_24970 [Streptomyces sp. Root63]|uniref:hypothetical protein n=1 Tax=unclassified Streptomyces TaxID=2593676 RepID=UPI0006FA52F8|nr:MULTISPECIES: hypothetical protein [unclassified Streptomyces]KQX27555.1 hypothetical protein ASD29_30200 [Streptomyces sp. Root1295]KRA34795.1 hypothetical protein ASD97_24970 [Streptomyces sp. Root63]